MRYDVEITIGQEHRFAIEANDPYEAQTKALEEVGNRAPEMLKTEINVTRGVR